MADNSNHERAIIEPNCFAFQDLDGSEPADVVREASIRFMQEMRETWGDTVKFARLTVVNDEHPNPPYPSAIYFEGWSLEPWKHDPPGRVGPFNYPLIALEGGEDR